MEFPESFIYAGPAFSAPEQPVPAPYFRRQFRLERVPEQAELMICGIGFYELYVNGQRITRGRLAPYISSPDVAVYYDSYDITPRSTSNRFSFISKAPPYKCPPPSSWSQLP